MLQKHLWVAFVLSGSCSGASSVGLLYYIKGWRWDCKHPPEDAPAGTVASAAVPWPGQPSAKFSTLPGLSPCLQTPQTWLFPASHSGVRASGAWQGTTGKVMKQAAINWWLVLGGSRQVTLLHFMVVLHLQVPAVSEIAWAGAVLYQFHSQQALQVKHFIVGVGLCFLLDSLK